METILKRIILPLMLAIILWTGYIAFAPHIVPMQESDVPAVDAELILSDHYPDKMYITPNQVVPSLQPPASEMDILIEFLKNDSTDSKSYTPDHICMDFSVRLAKNLTDSGYDAGCVTVTAKWHGIPGGHMITWVKLSNETLYIEPQRDWIYVPDEFRSGYNSSDYIIREISIQSAVWKISEQRKWNGK